MSSVAVHTISPPSPDEPTAHDEFAALIPCLIDRPRRDRLLCRPMATTCTLEASVPHSEIMSMALGADPVSQVRRRRELRPVLDARRSSRRRQRRRTSSASFLELMQRDGVPLRRVPWLAALVAGITAGEIVLVT